MIENATSDDDVVVEEVTATIEAPTEVPSAVASLESLPESILDVPVDFI